MAHKSTAEITSGRVEAQFDGAPLMRSGRRRLSIFLPCSIYPYAYPIYPTMKCWTFAALFRITALIASCSIAEAGSFDAVLHTHSVAGECVKTHCPQDPPNIPSGVILKTSERSLAIARRLDATGYYSRYSRALKGYPDLRSKRETRDSDAMHLVNMENRIRFRPHVQEIARKHSLDPKLIDAVIVVESAYDPNAVSPKGAIGLMQLMPDTAKRFDVADPFNAVANINGGARYLRWLMDRYNNDVKLVLAAYNAGEYSVAVHGERIPAYEETRAYISRVLDLFTSASLKETLKNSASIEGVR
jgi:hypothetical protein